MDISEALKENRISRNLSLMDIEKATGISNGNISRWENGQVIPGINLCIQLANFYGCTLDELVGISETTTKHNFPTQQQNKAVAFSNEYSVLIEDNNFQNIAKLCNNITPELRAVVLGYVIGLLQSQGVNTQKILGY